MEIQFSPDFLTVIREARTYKISEKKLVNFLAQVHDEELMRMAFHISEYRTLKDNKMER